MNRIWQKLFGHGLVRSVDYFGRRGERPSHPVLLDYLAARFVEQGWSNKRLIRELVLSRAYRMSSAHDAKGHAADSDNRLLWRMNRRRLDAEALRDALLSVSGRLLDSQGGPALPLEYPENVINLDPKDINPPAYRLKTFRPQQMRERTIYLPVVPSDPQPGPAELRNVFDFTQPAEFSGQRMITAVPTQALFLINSSPLKDRARDLAERVSRETTDTDARLDRLWRVALNRPITAQEQQEAAVFVSEGGNAGWIELCHAILASNEFLMEL